MEPDPRLLSALTEDELISRITESLDPSGPISGPGDDAAVIEIDQRPLLFCTDMLVEGIHFDLEISTPRDVGWKALAVNVSDVAAMGGRPRSAVISIAAPPGTRLDFFDDLYAGLKECASTYGVEISGGDLSSGGQFVINVALIGQLDPGVAPMLRSGARVGDLIYVTGRLGEAALGLSLATRTASPDHPWVSRHRRPTPRIVEGVAAASAGATAAIDISDGFLRDLGRLCHSSHLGAEIDLDAVPEPALLPSEAAETLDAGTIRNAALSGGDDYELCFTIDPSNRKALEREWPATAAPLTMVGQLIAGGGLRSGGRDLPEAGWDHFSPEDAR